MARFYYNATLKEPQMKETLTVAMEVRVEHRLCQDEPAEELEELQFDGLSKTVKIGSQLTSKAKASLMQLLGRNSDVFTWTHQDMLGIDPAMITHGLNVDPVTKPL